MNQNNEILHFFKHKTNKVNYDAMEKGDIAFHERTGEYIMGGYSKKSEFNNLELDLIVSRDENYGKFIVFASLLEEDLQLTIKADTDVLKEMFSMPHSHLLKRRGTTGGFYDIVETTIDISTGEIIFVKIGSVQFS